MKGSNGTNPAAGRRHLGAREHARLLDDQTDALALSIRLDEIVISIAPMLGELHRGLRGIETHTRRANERASAAIYEAPELSMVAA